MPQQATPTALTQRIVVLPASRSVSVVQAGAVGPRGYVGPAGPVGPEGPPGGTSDFVDIGGDTMTGNLTVPDLILPSGALEAHLTTLDDDVADLQSADLFFSTTDTQLQNQIDALKPTAWTTLTLINSWTNFNAGYQTARYRRVGDMVFVQGLIVGTAKTSNWLATLPSGFRPPLDVTFAAPSGSPDAYGRVDVQRTTGNIVYMAGSLGFFSLSSICFSII